MMVVESYWYYWQVCQRMLSYVSSLIQGSAFISMSLVFLLHSWCHRLSLVPRTIRFPALNVAPLGVASSGWYCGRSIRTHSLRHIAFHLLLSHYCYLCLWYVTFPLSLVVRTVPLRLCQFSTRVVIFFVVIDWYTLFVDLVFCTFTVT